jgi:hypothetical protein
VSVSISAVGATFADASSTATSRATGLGAGAGADEVTNLGEIDLFSTSFVEAGTVSVGIELLPSYASTDAASTAEAFGTGIDGGSDDDTLVNVGSIKGTIAASAEAGSVAINLAGGIEGDASTTARAETTGIAGGTGLDVISNAGLIDLTALADTDSLSVSAQLLGGAFADAGTTTEARATGIDGGTEDDEIVNKESGVIDLWAEAGAVSESVAANLLGVVSGDVDNVAHSTAMGIAGGEGEDTVRNDGAIYVKALTETRSTGTGVTLGGVSDASANTVASATAHGIDGGVDADTLENAGAIDVDSEARLTLDETTFALGGVASTDGTLAATTRSVAIAGGTGADVLRNEGDVIVSAESGMWSSGGSDVMFGQSGAGATLGAIADAVGIDGGDDADEIDNVSRIEVSSQATMTLDSSTFALGGVGGSEGKLTASTTGTGLAGGSGEDRISNSGELLVDVTSTLSSTGGSDVVFGQSEAGATSGAYTAGVGLDGQEDADEIENTGDIEVYSRGVLSLDESSYTFGGTGESAGTLEALTVSDGINGGSGEDRWPARSKRPSVPPTAAP